MNTDPLEVIARACRFLSIHHKLLADDLGKTLKALQDERQAAAKDREDAERYRQLRNNSLPEATNLTNTPWCIVMTERNSPEAIDGEWLDYEVDRARKLRASHE